MYRILLVGPPGSGKTTLAFSLQKELNIPLFNMDYLYISLYEKFNRLPTQAEVLSELKQIVNKHSWIIDGFYEDTFDFRLGYCSLVIFFDPPLYKCMYNVFRRGVKNFFKIDRVFLDNSYQINFYDKIRYLLNFKPYMRIFKFQNKKHFLMQKTIKKGKVIFVKNRKDILKAIIHLKSTS